jgi:hypothetical protein
MSIAGAFTAFIMCVSASAVTITFDPLTGENLDPYSGHVEGGFSVVPIAGNWMEAHLFGNPTPAILANTATARIEVTDGLFTFNSVDLADGAIDPCTRCATFSITGYLNNVAVLSTAGTTSSIFQTFFGPDPLQRLDRLEIRMTKGDFSYNIDNIVVNVVPEPVTLLLTTVGMAMLGVVNRGRLLRRRWTDKRSRTNSGRSQEA